jgi:hypothetical protein
MTYLPARELFASTWILLMIISESVLDGVKFWGEGSASRPQLRCAAGSSDVCLNLLFLKRNVF